MCGIYGIVDLREESSPQRASLSKMGGVMVHRGPDDEGQYFGKGVANNSPMASGILKNYFGRCQSADNINQNIYVDMKTSLPDDLLVLTDKMSMAASIECRAPFVDHELVELTSRIPSHLKVRGLSMKYLLKKAVKPWLPKEILQRKKRGFGAPVGAWLRRDLKLLVHDTLSEQRVRERGLFQWSVVDEMIRKHETQRGDYTDHLMALINLELWFRQFMDEQVRAPAIDNPPSHASYP